MQHRSDFRMWSSPVLGWAFYDFANTIFSFAIITRYFNEWVIDERGRPDWNVGLMGFVVGLLLVVAMPAFGAVSDQVGRRLPFLATFTTLCVLATATLGFVHPILLALVLAGFAIFTYQLALSMYDPLLATVAPPSHHGRVSGLGVGLGYLGVLVSTGVFLALVPEHHQQRAFVPTAVMFALFAIPIFAFVREPRRTPVDAPGDAPRDGASVVARRAVRQVRDTARHIRSEHRDTGRFLIARFLYVDAIATVIAYMTVYMNRVGDFTESQKTIVLGTAMVAAAGGAVIAGRLVERVGPKRVLLGILALAVTVLLVAAGTGSAGLVWVLGPAVGITLGGVATSDRVFMLRLTPAAVRGEFFGIYNLVGKLSSGIGPLLLWGGTIWLLHTHGSASLLTASRAALAVLAVAVVAGMFVLRPLRDHVRHEDETWEAAP